MPRTYGKPGSRTYVSPWVKWILFTFNLFFWVISLILIAVGIWAYIATEEFNRSTGTGDKTKDLFDYLFDFSLIFLAFGIIVFVMSLIGLLGSLRENICLIKTFSYTLGVIFLLELILAITVLALSSQVKEGLESILKVEAVEEYRDADINRRNVIDWFQETFECCGVSDKGYLDWELNRYFSCSGPGFEACSVPYSCCKEEYRFKYDSMIADTRCGHGMLEKNVSKADADRVIFVNGCVNAAIETAKDNLFIIGGVALAIILPQFIGIGLAQMLARQVENQKRF